MFSQIVDVLIGVHPHREGAEQAAKQILEGKGDQGIVSDLIYNLTGHRCTDNETIGVWTGILDHRSSMEEQLSRDPGIRVAALDYLGNILKFPAHVPVIQPQVLHRLYEEATCDPLTNLKNRRHFQSRMDEEIARAKRYGGHFALALFDLDDFKSVNDSSGHKAGDQVLRSMSEAISLSVRESDVAARWGGEEFIVLMPEASKNEAVQVADRIRIRLMEHAWSNGTTASGGVAAFPQDGDTSDEIFKSADASLYRAKREGKNRIYASDTERRSDLRVERSWPMTFQGLDQERGPIRTATVNVSRGGVGIRYDRLLSQSSPVRGEITIDEQPMPFVGEIAHAEHAGDGNFDIGIRFLDVEPGWKSALPQPHEA